jgi:hypothetical protein
MQFPSARARNRTNSITSALHKGCVCEAVVSLAAPATTHPQAPRAQAFVIPLICLKDFLTFLQH